MKLKNYIVKLQKLADKYPDATVVYSSDEEGNSFKEVVYAPTAGDFDGESFEGDAQRVNAVCVN